MTQTMLNFFNSSSGKLIIFVEGAGFEPAKVEFYWAYTNRIND